MFIEEIGRICLNYLRNTYKGFPDKGFIAGGCLANLVWEFVSGNKAIINDIDVFIYKGELIKDNLSLSLINDNDKLSYLSSKSKLIVDYSGICSSRISNDYYKIINSKTNGIFNIIEYKSSSSRKDIILDSFDINCTRIGYSIEEDKFYWKDDFEEFINTGILKLSNLLTPSHSAIRLIKKKIDLNCKLSISEIEMCKIAISRNYTDINKRYFTDKYSDLYEKYKNVLSKHFTKEKNEEVTKLFKYNENLPDIDIFELKPINLNLEGKSDIDKISYVDTLFFWFRNIYKNEKNSEVWKELDIFFESKDYIDCQFDIKDIKLIGRLIKFAPNSAFNLKGLTLSKQLKIVKNLFKKFSYDPIIAICLLESKKIDHDIDLDDEDILLLELSVRKEITKNDNRLNLILNEKQTYNTNNEDYRNQFF
jgi:hypothetical protein